MGGDTNNNFISADGTSTGTQQQEPEGTSSTDAIATTDTMTTNNNNDTSSIIREIGCVLIETSLGDIVIELPITCVEEYRLVYNFIQLCYTRYYNNTLINTVLPNRFCYCGCPVGNGTGGTSIYGLMDESVNDDYNQSYQRFLKSTTVGCPLSTRKEQQEKGRVLATCIGTIPDTIGSQFVITISGGPDHALDGYSIPVVPTSDTTSSSTTSTTSTNDSTFLFRTLGIVVEDTNNVLDKINTFYIDKDGRPYADIRIKRIIIINDPFEQRRTNDNNDDEITKRMDQYAKETKLIDPIRIQKYMKEKKGIEFDDTTNEVLYSPQTYDRPNEEIVPHRICITEILDKAGGVNDNNNNTGGELNDTTLDTYEQRIIEETETRSRAVVLEMLGDIPDAEITAPDNVLFICKLNSVTTDDDLQLIFSRFDENVTVEIIRDTTTGQSLQYAFAELTTPQQAAEAYFKMNNALIDDRRIKVDFSQSVAKLWDKYHQRMKQQPQQPKGGTSNSTTNRIRYQMPKYDPINDRQSNNNNNNNRNDSRNTNNDKHDRNKDQPTQQQQQQQSRHNTNNQRRFDDRGRNDHEQQRYRNNNSDSNNRNNSRNRGGDINNNNDRRDGGGRGGADYNPTRARGNDRTNFMNDRAERNHNNNQRNDGARRNDRYVDNRGQTERNRYRNDHGGDPRDRNWSDDHDDRRRRPDNYHPRSNELRYTAPMDRSRDSRHHPDERSVSRNSRTSQNNNQQKQDPGTEHDYDEWGRQRRGHNTTKPDHDNDANRNRHVKDNNSRNRRDYDGDERNRHGDHDNRSRRDYDRRRHSEDDAYDRSDKKPRRSDSVSGDDESDHRRHHHGSRTKRSRIPYNDRNDNSEDDTSNKRHRRGSERSDHDDTGSESVARSDHSSRRHRRSSSSHKRHHRDKKDRKRSKHTKK